MTLQHDGPIEISVGKHRKETNWRVQEMLWSAFVEKISTTHRTMETYSDYMKAKKGRQDEIKDIGGYVGGYITGGRRKADKVVNRSLVVLDADFPPGGLWEEFLLLFDCAAAIHSTHKHSPDNPRIRLIIPLDRPVERNEYEPIARHIADTLNIERFDPTTYEASRLMYWPSTSVDGEYLFEYKDGPRMCADEVLATYHKWNDSAEWPVSEREGTIIHKDMKAQEDPLEKKGIVGAFCRTYNIDEAIEDFLSDVYVPCDVPGRYSYAGGSTGAGLVVYDDKFTYSHHGTDPTSGMLCNAFDLVRIHKFGARDAKVREDTPTYKRPSYAAMEEFAQTLPGVRSLMVAERNEEAMRDFDGIDNVEDLTPEKAEEINKDWMGKLEVNKFGIMPTVNNMILILKNDPRLKGCYGYDVFSNCGVIMRDLPWRKITPGSKNVKDFDGDALYAYLEKFYKFAPVKYEKALNNVFLGAEFHPVQNYLNGLVWDKTERLDRLLIDYMGTDDSPYIRAITRKTLVGAVARVLDPGIKFDTVLTLVGPEGKRKSTLFAKLGGEWFSDSFDFNMLKDKQAVEQIQGVWIMEISEMSGLRKAEQSAVKGFLSKRSDRQRPAFGKNMVKTYRQLIFVSSTNELHFLQEANGHRRIWPATILRQTPVKSVADDLTQYEVDQLWAEAVMLYHKGEEIWLPANLEGVAKETQRTHTEEHPWTGVVRKYLETKLPKDWPDLDIYKRLAYLHNESAIKNTGVLERQRVSIPELWCEAMGKREEDIDNNKVKALHQVMQSFPDWEPTTKVMRYGKYGPQRNGYQMKPIVTSVTPNGPESVTMLHTRNGVRNSQ